MSLTPNLGLLYLSNAQQSKEVAVNESLTIVDVLLMAQIIDKDLTEPPAEPDNGDAYIVAASATGDWAGQDNNIAYWFDEVSAWKFITPSVGWAPFWVIDEATYYAYGAGGWEVFATGGGSAVTIITPDTSTTHTATAANNGGLLIFDSASDCVLTLPEAATEALDAGFHMLYKNVGGGNVSVITEGSDTLDGVTLSQAPAEPVTVVLEFADDTEDPNHYSLIGNNWLPTVVEDDALTAPPGSTPDVGAVYIPAATATGAWAGQENNFAIHVGSDVYQFVVPPDGWIVRVKENGWEWIAYNHSVPAWTFAFGGTA